ncbi:hypothetical protein J6N69_06220 [bacterium]|nr:hypothetical protein [bacterium]
MAGCSALDAMVFGVATDAVLAAALGTIPKESTPTALALYAVPTTSKPVARELDPLPIVTNPEPDELAAELDAPHKVPYIQAESYSSFDLLVK